MAGSSPAMTSEGSENLSPSKTFVEDGVMAGLDPAIHEQNHCRGGASANPDSLVNTSVTDGTLMGRNFDNRTPSRISLVD